MTPTPPADHLTSENLCSCCAWDITNPDHVVRLAAAEAHPGPVPGDLVDLGDVQGRVTQVDQTLVLVRTDDGHHRDADPRRITVLTPALRVHTRRHRSPSTVLDQFHVVNGMKPLR